MESPYALAIVRTSSSLTVSCCLTTTKVFAVQQEPMVQLESNAAVIASTFSRSAESVRWDTLIYVKVLRQNL